LEVHIGDGEEEEQVVSSPACLPAWMPDPKCVKDADDTDYSQYIADLCIFTADRLSLRGLVLVVNGVEYLNLYIQICT
jgi:hypothetical protein